MNRQSSSSFSGQLTVVALLAAAAGIAVQIVSGVDYPTVPPGLIILPSASGIVAFSAMVGVGRTELFELQKRGNLDPNSAQTEF